MRRFIYFIILTGIYLSLSGCDRLYVNQIYNTTFTEENGRLVSSNNVDFVYRDFDIFLTFSIAKSYTEPDVHVILEYTSPGGLNFSDTLYVTLDKRNCTKYNESFRNRNYEFLYRRKVRPVEFGTWKLDFVFDKETGRYVQGIGISIEDGIQVNDDEIYNESENGANANTLEQGKDSTNNMNVTYRPQGWTRMGDTTETFNKNK